MKYVVIFAEDFEAARKYAAEHNLQRGCWTFAHSAERIKHLNPDHCESVCLKNWSMNASVMDARVTWERRRAQTA